MVCFKAREHFQNSVSFFEFCLQATAILFLIFLEKYGICSFNYELMAMEKHQTPCFCISQVHTGILNMRFISKMIFCRFHSFLCASKQGFGEQMS